MSATAKHKDNAANSHFMTQLQSSFLLFVLLSGLTTFGQSNRSCNYLLLIVDTAKDEYGYINRNGDTVIQPGKYSFCFTDTFCTYAIVTDKNRGFVAIDKQQHILYKVFPFDNGPDYAADGLFRIIEKNKIGYADKATGKIVIRPRFDCAFPFVNGVAKVGLHCTKHSNGEHSYWTSDDWFYIDKKGRKTYSLSLKR